MLQENEGTISTQDQPTGSDIFVSVEMSRSKWVVGVHTPLADKIGLHTMACGDVEALLALIDRAWQCSGPSNGAPWDCESRFRFEPNSAHEQALSPLEDR